MVSVELVARKPPVPAAEPVAPAVEPAGRSRTIPLVLVGWVVIGVAGFAVFGALGRGEESDLKQDCAPQCSDQQVSSVRTKYLVGDISLGVGVLALAAGPTSFSGPSMPSRANEPASSLISAQPRTRLGHPADSLLARAAAALERRSL